MGDLNYTKIREKIKELNKKRILKNIIKIIVITFFVLYFIAFVMKDRANNEFSRTLCREFANAPRNIASLIVNKIHNGTMNYKTNIITKSEKNDVINTRNSLLAEKDSLVNDKNNLLQEKEALSNDKNNLLQEIQALKNQVNALNQKPTEKSPEQIVNEQENTERNQLIGYSNIIKQQKEIDDMLLSELDSGDYTFDDPLIIVDPYGNSPLTALIIFKTETKEKIDLSIEGISKKSSLHFSFLPSNEHILPIFGLYPNKDNRISIKMNNKNKKIKIKTDPLIKDLSSIKLFTTINSEDKYNSGFNFSHYQRSGIKMAFDIEGNIRWFLKDAADNPTDFNNLGSIFIERNNIIFEVNLLGKILSLYRPLAHVQHEIKIMDNEIYLTVPSLTINGNEDMIQILDRNSGKTKILLDYKNILQRSRKEGLFINNTNWAHINAIYPEQENLLISSNVQHSIVKNDRNGKIKWILSDPIGYDDYWKKYLLKPIGKKFEYHYNQHAVQVLPDYDKNPDTVDILLFDNGWSRNLINSCKTSSASNDNKLLYSRLVHYRINEVKMTVEQIWEFGKNRPELFSYWKGDADLLKNGNILGVFSRRQDKNGEASFDTVYIEVDRKKNIIWECIGVSLEKDNIYTDYRLERLPIYNMDSINLHIGDKVKNLIPEDLYKKYGLTKE